MLRKDRDIQKFGRCCNGIIIVQVYPLSCARARAPNPSSLATRTRPRSTRVSAAREVHRAWVHVEAGASVDRHPSRPTVRRRSFVRLSPVRESIFRRSAFILPRYSSLSNNFSKISNVVLSKCISKVRAKRERKGCVTARRGCITSLSLYLSVPPEMRVIMHYHRVWETPSTNDKLQGRIRSNIKKSFSISWVHL